MKYVDFKNWLENDEESNNEIDGNIVYLALEAYQYLGKDAAGEENDMATVEDYSKHLGMSAGDIYKKYYSNDDSSRGLFKGNEPLPSIEGIHWKWDIHITPGIDNFLIGNDAILESEIETSYYHESENSGQIHIIINPEQAKLLHGQLKPYKKRFRSKIEMFKWTGLQDAMKRFSKIHEMPLPSSHTITPVVPAAPNKKILDPRIGTIKRPGEDREAWLQRSVANKYPAIPDPSYNPSDNYYKKD